MSSNSQTPSVLVRFLDAFLQERNIKWILTVGMLILLGSSLLFVTTHWETYTRLWKHLFLLGYAAAIHTGGQWTYHRLGLRRTGTVLQGLMVLLIPVLFLALHWVPRTSASEITIDVLLLSATLVFSLAASWRIFTHVLREPQPTVVLSYLTLAFAGAVLPGLPTAWMPALAMVLWAVFAVGTVKVNRHVFWLTEEQRAPRMFGFFPIALLGSQFLFLYVQYAAPHVALHWMGFGFVLVAIPVLLTADTVAQVFQQRTGDLVRPLPWPVLLPLGVGLALCAAGVILATLSLMPPARPYALVLTAAGAAALVGLVARRTRKQAFVWAMLVGVTLAYNFSPVFFVELARAVVAGGAEVVREERLPYAFYGLSYVPLLIGLMVAAVRGERAGSCFFAWPIRWYAFALSCLLVAVSMTHPKALLPVGLVMVAMFAVQARLFQAWYAVLPAIIAWTVAAYGFTPFATLILGMELPPDAALCCLAFAAAALLWAGRRIDPWVARRAPARLAHLSGALCQFASLLVTLGPAAYWFAGGFVEPAPVWPAGVLIALLLIVQSLRWAGPYLSAVTILFVQSILLHEASHCGLTLGAALSLATVLLLCQWLLGYVLERYRGSRISRTFLLANDSVCWVWLTLLLVGIYLPVFAVDLAKPFLPIPPELAPLREISWPCRLLILLWGFDMARRAGSRVFATLAYLGLLALAGATFLNVAGAALWQWVPAVWAGVALAALPVSQFLHRRLQQDTEASKIAGYRALEAPITYLTLGVFGLVAIGSLVAFPWPLRVAGGLGLVGLVAFSVLRQQPSIRMPSLVLANWQVLGLVVLIFGPDMRTLLDLTAPGLSPVCLPLAVVAAGSLLAWQVFGRSSPWPDLSLAHRCLLRVLFVLAIQHTLTLPALEFGDIVLAGAAFALAVLAELVSACRNNREEQVWAAEVLALLGVAYLTHFRVVVFGRGTTMFVVLAVGLALWLVKEWAARRPRLAVLVRPLGYTAFVMPLVTVGIGVYRHLATQPVWLGANSLALLLAAGFYFWRGIERGNKWLLILAGAILNVALVLLWRELAWNDPQFFMIPLGISVLALVQVLKEEIPERFHDPLRYLGALVILVSPTFHIVGGSWVPLLSLMVASVAIVLLAIGLRVRALLYTGTAFLLADLAAMVVRGSIDNPNVLWVAGIVLGTAVVTLGAVCERHRETLVLRMRVLADALKQWD